MAALLSWPLARLTLDPLWRITGGVLWSDVGTVSDFAVMRTPTKLQVSIEQRDGWRKMLSEKPVYVVKSPEGRLRVLSAVCPHLGCSINWDESRGQFVCPCHSGVFAPDGTHLSGPPPRGMDELESTVADGRLKVHYQYFRQLLPNKEVVA